MTKDIDFSNFHERTIAVFHPAQLPEHESTFVSESGSAYWDMADRVIRCSDHWAGQNGCVGQASCIWSIEIAVGQGGWATGSCAYERFVARKRVPIHHALDETDRAAARHMAAAGGAMSLQDWVATGLELPLWACRVFRGPSFLPRAAQALFMERPDLRHAVCADGDRLDRILDGQPHITLGTRLSLPADHDLPTPDMDGVCE